MKYDLIIDGTAATLSAATAPIPVAQTLTGLTPGTVFHYRIVALHGSTVVSPGIDGVFMTHPSKRPKAGITARTKPGTDRKRPYAFTTSGSVNHRNIPGTFACNGTITVTMPNDTVDNQDPCQGKSPDINVNAS